MRQPLLPALLLLAATSCTSVSAIPRFGMLNIDGEIGVNDASSGISSTNDFDAVGIDDDDAVLGGRVDLEVGGMHTTFQIADSSHDGSGTLEAEISDGTTTIPAGTDVDSDLDLLTGGVIVTWDLVPGDTVEVGIGLGASVFDVDSRFRSPSTGDSISVDETVPIPLLAARAGVDFGRFDVSAVLGGMALEIDGDDASVFDLDLLARMTIFGAAGRRVGAIVAGYRFIDLSIDYEDSGERVETDAQLSGPYIGLSVGF